MSHAPTHAGLDHASAWGNVAIERLLVTAAGSLAGGLALACGGLLLVRRLTGGVTTPPGAAALAVVCGVGGLLVAAGDLAARHRGGRGLIATRIGFAMAALATALPLPATPTALVMALATLACAAALLVQPSAGPWLGLPPLRGGSRGWWSVEPPTGIPADLASQPHEAPSSPPGAADWLADQDTLSLGQLAPDEHLLQHQQRFTRADGSECIRGRLFLAVPTGVRTASGHVGFCPPFATIPAVDVTTAYDEVEAIVAAAEVLPWGVRVECRLDEPADESFEIPIDIVAISPPPSPQPTTSESCPIP